MRQFRKTKLTNMLPSSQQSHHSHQQHGMSLFVTAIFYTLLLAYGTLYPLSSLHWPSGNMLNPFFPTWPEKLHTSDVITNFLVYIPFGFLIALLLHNRLLRHQLRLWILLIVVMSIGVSLSFLLEYLQTYLPSRVTSLSDVFLNGLGSLFGASFILFVHQTSTTHHSPFQRKLAVFNQHWFTNIPTTQLGLTVLALWTLSQILPLVPSLDFGNLRAGLRPLWYAIHDPSLINPWQATVYALNITGLGILASTVLRDERHILFIFLFFVTTVLLLKVPIVGRQLSAESLLGLITALATIAILRTTLRITKISLPGVAAVAIGIAFFVGALHSDGNGTTRPINWIPFLGHMNNVMDLVNIIAAVWPFTALAYFASLYAPPKPKLLAISGGCFIFTMTLGLEWIQQYLPGRYPDITDALLATLGWSLPWLYINTVPKKTSY